MLPAVVRREANILEGAEVIARSDGEGRVVIETLESIKARVWAAAPLARGLDVTTDIRELRDQDSLTADAASQRRKSSLGSASESRSAGAVLLAHLGL